tara:strand:+ start:3148 stop:3324 length:177 start_codon:yes stop_codon:yes gene_type:complete
MKPVYFCRSVKRRRGGGGGLGGCRGVIRDVDQDDYGRRSGLVGGRAAEFVRRINHVSL